MGIFFCSSELEDVLLICTLGCNVENPIHSWAAARGSPWQCPCLWDVWHSAIQRGGLTLGLSHFSERKNLKILWPQLFCYVCKQSGKWGQDINTSQMRTGKSLQAKAVCHAWKHRLRCQRQAVMRKWFQRSCFIRDPGQTALYPGGRLSASCWENTYQRSLLGNCGSTNAALQLGLNHLCGWKDEFRDVNQP